MHTESATVAPAFGIEVRVRRGLAVVSFKARSGLRVEERLAPQGDSTAALLAAADEFLAAEGIDLGGDWSFIPGGGFRSMGVYA